MINDETAKRCKDMIYSIFIFMYPCPLRFGNANRVKEVCISNIKEKQRRINDGNVVNTCDLHIAVTRRVRRTGRKGLIDDFRTGEQDFVCGRIKNVRWTMSVTNRGEPFFVWLNRSRRNPDKLV